MMIHKKKLYFFFVLIVLSACQQGDSKRIVPDVSAYEAKVKIHRFEQTLFAIDSNNVVEGIEALEKEHPEFSDVFFTQVLKIKPLKGSKPVEDADADYKNTMRGFITHSPLKALYDTTQLVFADLSAIEKEMEEGFKFMQYYFEGYKVPKIYSYISEYSLDFSPPTPNTLGIGLDMFFGDYQPYYSPYINMPRFIAEYQTKERIATKAFKVLINQLSTTPPSGNRLIDYMIYNGKKLYILDHVLPHTPDSIKMDYTATQVENVEYYEYRLWEEIFVHQLYETDYRKYRKLVDPGPTTPGTFDGAPARIGNWFGWQIVENYMKRHPETTFSELLALDDTQLILDASKYKPKKRK